MKDELIQGRSYVLCVIHVLVKSRLSNKPACSISYLSTVKKHIYHPLYAQDKTHDSADRELTPSLGENFFSYQNQDVNW